MNMRAKEDKKKNKTEERLIRIPNRKLCASIPRTPLVEEHMSFDSVGLTLDCVKIWEGLKLFKEFKKDVERFTEAEFAVVKKDLFEDFLKIALKTENYLIGGYIVRRLEEEGRSEDIKKILRYAKIPEIKKIAGDALERILTGEQRKIKKYVRQILRKDAAEIVEKILAGKTVTIDEILHGIDDADAMAKYGEVSGHNLAVYAARAKNWLISGYVISLLQDIKETNFLRMLEQGQISAPLTVRIMARLALDEIIEQAKAAELDVEEEVYQKESGEPKRESTDDKMKQASKQNHDEK